MITFRQDRAADGVNPPSTIEIKVDSADLNAGEVVEYFRQFLAACGYGEQTIRDVLGEE